MTRSFKRPVTRVAICCSIVVVILCLLTFIFPPPPSVTFFTVYGLLYRLLFWCWAIFLIWWPGRFLKRPVLRVAVPFSIMAAVTAYLLSSPGQIWWLWLGIFYALVYGVPVWLSVWAIRLVWWLATRKRHTQEIQRPAISWSIEPLLALVLFGGVYTDGFLKMRFAISRPFFDSAVRHGLALAKETHSYGYHDPFGNTYHLIGLYSTSGRFRKDENCVAFRISPNGGFIYYLGDDGQLPYVGTNSGHSGSLSGPWGYWSE